MTRVAMYVRVSTDGQERDGSSLDSQEQACRQYAQRAGWTVAACIRDTASGYSLDRPGMEQLRSLVRQGGVDVVLAYAVDRLSRNQNHIGVLFDELQTAGARLECVTETFEDSAVGRFILAARAFVAEVEREKIVERTARGKTARAQAGKLPQGTGKGIYGYVYDPASGTRTVHPEQGRWVRYIFQRFVAGISLHGLSVDLNRQGVPTLTGRTWHPLTLRRMLQNETYTGHTFFRRTRVEQAKGARAGRGGRRVVAQPAEAVLEVTGATPALIDRETFLAAQTVLADPERRKRGQPNHVFRLRGRLRCLACDTPMTGQGMDGGRYLYYRCGRAMLGHYATRCASRYVPVRALEHSVGAVLEQVLTDPSIILVELRRHESSGDEDRSHLTTVRRDLARVEQEQQRLAALYLKGTLAEEVLDVQAQRLRSERERLVGELRRLESLTQQTVAQQAIIEQLPAIQAAIREWIAGAGVDGYALLLEAMQVQVKAADTRVEVAGVLPVPFGTRDQGDCFGSDLATIARTPA